MNKPRIMVFLVVWVTVMSILACSLTDSPPPTLAPLAPQSSFTPNAPLQASPVLAPVQNNTQVAFVPLESNQNVPGNISVENMLTLVDGNRMLNTITMLQSFQNRHALGDSSPTTGVQAARDWLFNQLEEIRRANTDKYITVDLYPFNFQFGGKTYTSHNVVMVQQGTDGDAGVVMIGAHYDTISQNQIVTTNYQPGANDNGSGTAAVLEVARLMAQRTHRATLIFILFGAEELGRYGSIAYVQEMIAQRAPIRAMINLDIVGSPTGPRGERFDTEMRVYSAPPNTSDSRHLARLVELVARTFVPNMRVNIQETVDRLGRYGDHQSFSDRGFAAVRLIEQMDDLSRTHNANDTIEDIDGDYLRRVVQVSLATALVVANGPDRPSLRMDTNNWVLEWTPSRNAVQYVVAFRAPGSLSYTLTRLTTDTFLQWDQFPLFEAVAVAGIDGQGQLGPFSTEYLIRAPVE